MISKNHFRLNLFSPNPVNEWKLRLCGITSYVLGASAASAPLYSTLNAWNDGADEAFSLVGLLRQF